MSHSRTDHSKSPKTSKSFVNDVDFGEGIDLVAGLTAAALSANQLGKVAHSKKHKTEHLAKAGLGAVVALGALEMFRREHEEGKHHHDGSRSRSSYIHEHPHNHGSHRHLADL